MSERTVEEALATADVWRNLKPDSSGTLPTVEQLLPDFVLLADEVLRLQRLNERGDAALLACSKQLRIVGDEVLRLREQNTRLIADREALINMD